MILRNVCSHHYRLLSCITGITLRICENGVRSFLQVIELISAVVTCFNVVAKIRCVAINDVHVFFLSVILANQLTGTVEIHHENSSFDGRCSTNTRPLFTGGYAKKEGQYEK